MEKNQLIKNQGTIYRVLAVEEEEVLLIDCIKKAMPKWFRIDDVDGFESCTEEELLESTETVLVEEENMPPKTRQTVHKRFTVIAGILLLSMMTDSVQRRLRGLQKRMGSVWRL